MCRALNILFLHVPLYVIDPYKLPEIRLAYRLLLIVAGQDWLMFVYRLHRLKKDTCASSFMFDITTNFMQSVHLSTLSTVHSVWSSIHPIKHKQILSVLDLNEVFEECGLLLYTKVAFMALVLELWQTKGMSKPFVFICITFPTGEENIPAPLPATSLLIYMWSVFMNDDRCAL